MHPISHVSHQPSCVCRVKPFFPNSHSDRSLLDPGGVFASFCNRLFLVRHRLATAERLFFGGCSLDSLLSCTLDLLGVRVRVMASLQGTMRAVQYSKFGGGASALEHVEVPVPTPVKEQVLVKIEAASINPVDWKAVQKGVIRLFAPAKLPHIPGTDIGGEVVALGPGVTSFAIGDKVSSWTGLALGGSLAEYAVAPIKSTAKIPGNVSALDGASFGCAGSTALQSVRDCGGIKLDGSSKDKNVLVTAASGGVGTYVVQLAKLAGAHVTATCGPRNIDLVKSLGADEVLDYKTPEGEKLQSPSGKKYDVVIHCGDSQPFAFFKPQLARTAKVVDLTPSAKGILTSGWQTLTFSSQKVVPFLMKGSADDLALLANLVSEGKLRTVVDSTTPLSKAEQAWQKQIDGHSTGKVLVTMVGE